MMALPLAGLNGKSFLEVFAKAPRTITRTTPAGRHVTTTLDNKGRVVMMEVPGVLPVQLAYDAHGRLETVTQGMRILTRGTAPRPRPHGPVYRARGRSM